MNNSILNSKSTTVFLYSPVRYLSADVLANFLNPDGSEPLGSVFFPRVSIVLPQENPHVSMVVNATFTTPQEFVLNPPPNFVVMGGKELTLKSLVSALEFNYWASYNAPERFVYTLFNDGVLVWGWVWNWG